MSDRVLNVAERAACLGVSVRTFQRLNKAGMGPKGCTLSGLKKWLKNQEKGPTKSGAEELFDNEHDTQVLL